MNLENLSLNYTGIGSFPFKDKNAPENAVKFIFDNFKDIPYWPQLPHFSRKEDMVLQITGNLAGYTETEEKSYIDKDSDRFFEELETLFFDYETVTSSATLFDCEEILDKYAIKEPYSSAISLFLNELNNHDVKFVKGSVAGPFTVSTSLKDNEGKCVFYDETLRDVCVKTLALKSLWQIKEFKKVKPDCVPIIFMDEPSISQIGSCAFLTVKDEEVSGILKEISDIIKHFGALSGVHCCGKTDWKIPLNAGVDIINFDAFSFTQSVALYAKELKNFMKQGGFLSFGIVPTLDSEALNSLTGSKLREIFEASLSAFTEKGISRDFLLKHSFITPSCGCGSLSEEEAAKAVKLTKELSEELRGIA